MRNILVEPDELDATALRVEQSDTEYERLLKGMISTVENLETSWQGKDNTAYTSQIKSFEVDLKNISMIMKEFVDFLRNTARGYRETQNELYAEANRLRT